MQSVIARPVKQAVAIRFPTKEITDSHASVPTGSE